LSPSPADDGHRKKELKDEISGIRGFTLLFESETVEAKWQKEHMPRHIAITTRYLFAATIFQGLFYWGDVLESRGRADAQSALFHLLCLRLLIGGFTLLGCFLVSTGLVVPSQMTVFWVNLCYGVPSLTLFYLARPQVCVYDSFFLVYGLCFFMLPKISPLNFIFGFSGAALFTILFIYISAFRLGLYEWLLSNTLLMVIVLLFMYISYSSERVARERWLLRERLKREKINLRIVASSISDDLTRSVTDERPFPLDAMRHAGIAGITGMGPFRTGYDRSTGKAIRLLATLGGSVAMGGKGGHGGGDPLSEPHDTHKGAPHTPAGLDAAGAGAGGSSSSSNSSSDAAAARARVGLFFRGIAGWALCYVFGYAFDFVAMPASAKPRYVRVDAFWVYVCDACVCVLEPWVLCSAVQCARLPPLRLNLYTTLVGFLFLSRSHPEKSTRPQLSRC